MRPINDQADVTLSNLFPHKCAVFDSPKTHQIAHTISKISRRWPPPGPHNREGTISSRTHRRSSRFWSASEMTYIESGGALTTTRSITHSLTGLVGWPTADALPTKWSHVNHRSGAYQGKSASQRPAPLPMSHAAKAGIAPFWNSKYATANAEPATPQRTYRHIMEDIKRRQRY